MTNLLYYWLIIGLIFLILEVINPGLFLFLSISLASLAGVVSSLFGFSFQEQIYIFFGSFLVIFIALTLWLQKIEKKTIPKSLKTNTFALQGAHGVVTHEITPLQKGYIVVDNQIWLAQSAEHCPIGSVVEVITISGCHCMVKRVQISN